MGSFNLGICYHGNADYASVQLPLAHHRQDNVLEDTGGAFVVSLSISQVCQGSHKLWKSWKTWKITKKKFHAWKNHGI